MNLVFALCVLGQLQAPLTDAACVYRAQPYNPGVSIIPNEGTRPEPLILGTSPLADAADPPFVIDPIAGPSLEFNTTNNAISYLEIPGVDFNGNLSIAMRRRPLAVGSPFRSLGGIAGTNQVKYFMLHQVDGSGLYYSRFWSANWSQVPAISTTQANVNRSDTIVTTWNTADNTNRIYVNGLLEGAGSNGQPRLDDITAYYPGGMWFAHTNGMVGAIAVWNRALSNVEIAGLQLNEDWYSQGGGGGPPVHVGVFVLRRNGVDEALPQGTVITIDGNTIAPPTGSVDKIIDIDTP